MRLLLVIVSLLLTTTPTFAESSDEPSSKTIMVLDGSGSMWGQIDGVSKIEIARDVIGDVVTDWNPEDHLGLIAYGHRTEGDCNDIEELITVGPLDQSDFTGTVNGISPKGKTPLSRSVQLAAEKLQYEEYPATVILVTDGLETCGADPCAMADELEGNGIFFTSHVVAFGLSEAEGQTLRCIADNTGGLFLSANNAGDLRASLSQAAEKAKEEPKGARLAAVMRPEDDPIAEDFIYWTIFDGEGNEVKGTNRNLPLIDLAPGDYRVTVRHGPVTVEDTITVPEDREVDHTVVTDTGYVSLKSRQTAADPILEAGVTYTAYRIDQAGAQGDRIDFNNNTVVTMILPAGTQRIMAEVGPAQIFEDVSVTAGETTDLTIDLNIGELSVSSTLNGVPVDDGTYWYVYRAGPDGETEGSSIAFNNNAVITFQLRQGDYILRASNYGESVDKYVPVSVKAGETTEAVVELK